jgi:hypothetical protein
VLEIYGRNVLTTEGEDGKLHRKVTGKLFSERNNRLVHEESVRQAIQMMTSWESKGENGAVVFERYHSLDRTNLVRGLKRSNLRYTSLQPLDLEPLSIGRLQAMKSGRDINSP